MAGLTEFELKALTHKDAGRTIYVDGGIRGKVSVTQKGISVWFRYRYKFHGQQFDLTIGTWPKNSLKKIRADARAARTKLDNKIDPALDKKSTKLNNKIEQARLLVELGNQRDSQLEATQKVTVNDLFQRWLEIDICNHKDKGREIIRSFNKDVLPYIGKMQVESVTKSNVMAIVDAILDRGADRAAKVTFSLIRQMFRFAQDRGIIETEPTISIRKSKIGKPATERDRYLSDDEIKELFRKMPGANFYKTTESSIWIALSTGCRIGELLQAKWQHINLDDGIWTIPPENSKNGVALTIYLSQFSINHFRILQSINHNSEWCYPNRSGKSHVCLKTITKQVSDRQLLDGRYPMKNRSCHSEALKLTGGKWTMHDLRRTSATLMTSLGVLPDIADKCLNHKEQNRIRRTYLRHNYEAEMREAWNLLGNRLELLTQSPE